MAKVRTAAQRAASRRNIKIAQEARRRMRANRNRGKAPSRRNRGEGFLGLRRNFVPYIRINKRSQTIGYNTGTYIKGTNKRVVTGRYIRLENATKKNGIDRSLAALGNSIAPRGTRRGTFRNYVKNNVTVTNPALRAGMGGAEVRVSTSRGAGPTVVLRRGRHKVSRQASRKAIKRYDTHARKLNAKRQPKPRPQRRKANRGR